MHACRYLEELQLDPTFYSLRWITTLLSREFALPDTLRLWDSLFAAPLQDRTRWVDYFCVTMCISIRDSLLDADFAGALHLLQSYPPWTPIDDLLKVCGGWDKGRVWVELNHVSPFVCSN